MTARFARTLCFATGLILSSAANAQHGGGDEPIEVHEGVDHIFGLPAGEVYEDFFPTEVVPNRRKNIRFAGTFQNNGTSQSASMTLWMDWLDPRLPGGQQTTPPFVFDILPGMQRELHTGQFIIPFTPQELSIHIQNDGPGGPVAFTGTFTHITWPIPEPSALVLGVSAAVALLARRPT